MLSGFELFPRWVPLTKGQTEKNARSQITTVPSGLGLYFYLNTTRLSRWHKHFIERSAEKKCLRLFLTSLRRNKCSVGIGSTGVVQS